MFELADFTFQNILGFATICISLATLMITYVLFNKQQDAEIIVYIAPSQVNYQCIDLVVENIGNGLARNVSFTTDKPIPKSAFGFEQGGGNDITMFDDGVFINGIAYFFPKEQRRFLWGQYHALNEALEDGKLNITVQYSSKRFGGLCMKKHTTTSLLDIATFRYVSASNKSIALLKKVESLREEIKDSFRKTNGNFRDLNRTVDALLKLQNKETKRPWERNHK